MSSRIDDLKKVLLKKGSALIGYANLDVLPPGTRENFQYGISFAVALNPRIIEGIQNGPTKEYYAEYNRANEFLKRLGLTTVRFLENLGYRATALAATNVGIDPATHSTKLPHKTVATRAGLGWIGKCALLVTEQYGSAIRIATVLTDAELIIDKPIVSSRCEDCMSCVEVCPGKASSGKNWEIGKHRDTFFNAFECNKAAKKLAAKVGIDATICGICIAACPWTQEYIKKSVLQYPYIFLGRN